MRAGLNRWRQLPDRAREVTSYLVVGGLVAILDVLVYQYAYVSLSQGAVEAKVEATAIAAIAAYVLHKNITFGHREGRQTHVEVPLYVLVNALSIVVGVAVIAFARYALGQTDILALQIANVVSIALAVIVRYVGYRHWVFAK